MVDLIDFFHFNLMENINDEGKERDGVLVFPEYSLHEIPHWNHKIYSTIIVIFFSNELKSWGKCEWKSEAHTGPYKVNSPSSPTLPRNTPRTKIYSKLLKNIFFVPFLI